MPKFKITDHETGDTLVINADKEPTEADVSEIFQKQRFEKPKLDVGALLKGPVRGETMGPLGPVDPAEGVRVFRDIPAAITTAGQQLTQPLADMAVDWLRRTGIDPSAEPDKPLIDLTPRTPPSPDEGAIRGGLRKASEVASGFTSPRQAAMLPLLPFKAVQALFGAESAAGIPQSIEEIGQSKTPAELGSGLTGAAANLLIAGSLGKNLLKGEAPTRTDTGTAIPQPEIPIKTEVKNAIPERSAKTAPVDETPGDRGEVGARVPEPEKAPDAQTQKAGETPVQAEVKTKTLTPAIQAGDKVFTGKSHADAFKAAVDAYTKNEITDEQYADAEKNFKEDKGHVFLADDGKTILDRERGYDWYKQTTGKEPTTAKGKLHSEDMTDEQKGFAAQPKPATPPVTQKQPELVGMGGAVPSEFQGQGTPTSNKNAVVDRERTERGLPPMMSALKQTFGEWWTKAMARIDQDPGYQDRLISELLEKPRALTGEENAALLQRRADLRNEYEKAARDGQQAYEDGRDDGVQAAKQRIAMWSDKLVELEQAVGKGGAGTESGRSLAARKMMMNSDFSLASLEMQKRAAKGFEPLTDKERQELIDLHNKLQATEKAYQDYIEKSNQRVSELEAQKKIAEIRSQVPPIDKRVLDFAESVISKMEKAAEPAAQRLRERLSRMGTSPDPTIIADAAIVGSARIARMGLDLAKWTDSMVRDFGEKIKPMLQEIWSASNQLLEERLSKSPEAVKRHVKKQDPIARIDESKAAIDAKVKRGEQNEITPMVQKLVRAIVERDPKIERGPLVDEVHGILKEFLPDISRREAMDAISGYGDFRQLTKDQISQRVRDLKGQLQQVAKLEDIQARKPPLKSGVERRTPSDEERKLIKQVNELKRRLGVVVTDPATQLKSALDARKTYYKNQIADLEAQIKAKERFVKTKTPSPTDAELESLKQRRAALKEEFDQIFQKPGLTDEQRVKMAIAAAEKSIAELERRIKEHDIFPKPKVSKTPATPELQAIRARREELRNQLQELHDADENVIAAKRQAALKSQQEQLQKQIAELQSKLTTGDLSTRGQPVNRPAPPGIEELKQQRDALNKLLSDARKKPAAQKYAEAIQRKVEALNKRISEVQSKIASGDLSTKPKSANRPMHPELEMAKQRLEGVNKQLHEARHPPKTPDQIALQALKTRLTKNIQELEGKLASGDFSKAPKKPPIVLDAEAQALKAKNERLKRDFQDALIKDRLKNRTNWEKALDWGVKYRRFGVLSSLRVIPKLISAGLQRLGSLPIEEIPGEVMTHLPGVSEVSKRAPLEGGGLNLVAEMKGFKEAFTQGLKDAYDVLKTGRSDLDILYGKPRASYTGEFELNSALLEFPGRVHGSIKSPVKRAVFERAVDRLGKFYTKQGLDLADPMVKARIAIDAYKAANRSIFLQDNFISSKVNAFLSEVKDPATGHTKPGSKLWSTAGRVALPITRVPINIVAETMQYAGGLASGSVRLANAFRKGVENLSPEQADLIMRELKKGSVGAAVLALGYFNSDVVGGYYQPGEKRKPGDVKAGRIRVFGVDVPSWLLHNPLLETAQMGATIRRYADTVIKGEKQGVPAGAVAAAIGAVEQVPFVRESVELEKALDPRRRSQVLGEQAKSIAIPAAVSQAAEWMDPAEKRKPKTVLQHIESGIPVLREQVPER